MEKKEINLNNIDNKVGENISKTTNYLKSVSDYIEKKLYTKDGETKNGGVKSLSLTFAMLVGFAMAVVVLSSVVITVVIMSKNGTITKTENSLDEEKVKLKISETNKIYWQERYNNVYSQCDSIGYVRAKQALDFSRNLQEDFEFQKLKIKYQAIKKQEEMKDWENINNKVSKVLGEN